MRCHRGLKADLRHCWRIGFVAVVGILLVTSACDRQKIATPAASGPVAPSNRPAAISTLKPLPAIQRAVLISVDGMRPDLIYRAKATHLIALLERSAFTLWGQTSEIPITLPSHTSMVTGVKPSRHGITYNEFHEGTYPLYPTIFEEGRAAGLTTAFVTGKAKLQVIARPGSLTWQFIEDAYDDTVADEACRMIRINQPGILMIHFRGCDYGGHFHGWGSPEQLEVLHQIDAGIGRIIATLDEQKLTDTTFLLVTADHGGAGTGHGNEPRGNAIPWIASGPGLRKGFDLDRLGYVTVHTEDTFATICLLLGIPIHPDIDGTPIRQIIDPPAGSELMFDR